MASILGAVEVVSLDAVLVSERNPRRGDMEAIKQSLRANDQYAVIVSRRTGEVLVGNHRVMAARELGWVEIAVCFVDVDDEHARRIMLADNRTSDLAGYDDEALAALLLEVGGDLTGTACSRADLDALLDAVSSEFPVPDDDVPGLPSEATTKPGDVLDLGEHRLACGDARDAALVAAPLRGRAGGELAHRRAVWRLL